MSCRAVCVPPPCVEEILPLVRPLIARATARCGDWTEAEIVDELRQGRMLLWLAVDTDGLAGIATSQIVRSRAAGRICNIVLCSGRRMRRWAHLKDAIEAYAQVQGCARVRMSGRRGWARVFRDYRQPYVTLEKSL